MSKKQMSPAEKEAREMIAEMKMQAANKRAFDAADSTPPAPAAPAPAPRPPMPQRPMPQGGMPGMSKGGKVGSASKRADGIAQKGKTRGKMC